MTSSAIYPDLKPQSTEPSQRNSGKLLKALYSFKAKRRDELDLEEG